MASRKAKPALRRPVAASRRLQELKREHDYESEIPGAWREEDSRYGRTAALLRYVNDLEDMVARLGGKVTVERAPVCPECLRPAGEEHKMDCSRTLTLVVPATTKRIPTKVKP